MALTRITKGVIKPNENYDTHNINSTGIITATKFVGQADISGGSIVGTSATFTGNVSIGGTLTYEDVTNIDSVGIITARDGLKVLAGGANVVGVVTATSFTGSGANLTNLDASDLASGTVPTARLGSGTANSSTFLAGDSTYKTVTGTTINNNANNRVITGSDTANTLEAETSLYFNPSSLKLSMGTSSPWGQFEIQSAGGAGSVFHAGGGVAYAIFSNASGTSGDKVMSVRHLTSGGNRLAIGKNADNYGSFVEKFAVGSSGQLGIAGANYGTSGQVLTSGGSGATASWTTLSTGPGTGQQYVNLESLGSASNTGNNTFAGYLSGNSLNSADHSTFFGYQAGKASLNAGNNCFFGSNSGLVATGGDNSGFGQGTLETITSATSNVAVGRRALNTTTSSENVAIGADTLRYQSSGSKNTAVGRGAGEHLTTTSDNVAIGFEALRGSNTSNPVTGASNIAIGSAAGDALRAGSQNILIGQNAGGAMTGGHWNCIIGKDALQTGDCNGSILIGLDAGTGSTGGYNVVIGKGAADIGGGWSGSNNIIIGKDADPSSTSVDNEITLGDSNITKFRIPGLNFHITSGGEVGIGTINPGKSLHVSSSTPAIRLTDTDTAGPLHCDIESASGDLYLDTGSVHRDVIITSVGKSNEIARFTGDGYVTMGRNAALASARLSLQCTSGDPGISIQTNASGGTTDLIKAYSSAGPNVASICVNPDSTPDILFKLHDGSNTVERLRITSSGYMGINTTSPQRYLHIVGNDGATGASLGNSDTQLVIDNAGTNGAMIEFLSSNNGAGHLMFTDTDGVNRCRLSYHHNGDYFRVDTAGNERLRINSTGQISAGGSGGVWGNALVSLITPSGRTTAFDAADGDTWHDVVIKNTAGATNNAVGLAFQITSTAYHKNAGVGIAAVKNGINSDYGADLVVVTRPQSAVAKERLRITSDGALVSKSARFNNYQHLVCQGGSGGDGIKNYILVCKTNTVDVRLAGEFVVTRQAGASGIAVSRIEATLISNNAAGDFRYQTKSMSTIGQYPGMYGQWVTLTYGGTNYYAIRLDPVSGSSRWASQPQHCYFKGTENNCVGNGLGTIIDDNANTISSITELNDTQGAIVMRNSKVDIRGEVAIESGKFSVASETNAMSYQVLSGYKTFSASDTFVGLAYIGHTHSLQIQYMIIENNNYALGGAHGECSFFTTYGSSSGPQNHSFRRYAMNGGRVNADPVFQYCNGSCGSHGNNYVLKAKVGYSGSTHNFTIRYVIRGLSGGNMYV